MDKKGFIESVAETIGPISGDAAEGFALILAEAEQRGTPTNKLAYMLATAWWETAKTMQPVREAFFVASTFEKAEKWRKKHLHYYPYYGRGYVQLTWKANYKKASERYGRDFVSDPDGVMDRKVAVAILFDGMADGWFTGKALDDYIDDIDEADNDDLAEYKQARRIINGTDKAQTIALLAIGFEHALRSNAYAPADGGGPPQVADAAGAGGAPPPVPPVAGGAALTAGTGTFAQKLVQKAETEFANFQGVFEQQSPLRERIGTYWTFLGRPDLDGSDHEVPWSAAFISTMVHLAGAGTNFPYSAQHSVYFYRTINDKLINKKTSFWGYKAGDIGIRPGDIVGMNRASAAQIDYLWASTHADYSSHADIVVSVADNAIITVGGNVGAAPGQVARKTFVPSGGGWVNQAAPNQKVFVVIRSSLP